MIYEVSVISPCFNAIGSVERCVESVIAQNTDFGIEHIIIDDGSTDGTPELLESLSEKYSHITVIMQSNQGAGVARNRGIEVAKGTYIAFLDSDDYWLPEKLSAQIAFMKQHKHLFTYGDYLIEQSAGIRTVFTAPASLQFNDLLTKCPIGCLTACYNQQEIGKVFMPDIKRGQDWGFWLTLLRKGITATKYPGIHAVYTVNAESLSSNKIKKMEDVFKVYRCVLKFGFFKSAYFTLLHSLNVLKHQKRSMN